MRELPPLEDFAPDEESKQFIRERLSGRSISSTLEEAAEDLAEEQELLREDYTDDDIDDIGHIDGIDYDAEILARREVRHVVRGAACRMVRLRTMNNVEDERIVPMRLQRFWRERVASRRGSERLATRVAYVSTALWLVSWAVKLIRCAIR